MVGFFLPFTFFQSKYGCDNEANIFQCQNLIMETLEYNLTKFVSTSMPNQQQLIASKVSNSDLL